MLISGIFVSNENTVEGFLSSTSSFIPTKNVVEVFTQNRKRIPVFLYEDLKPLRGHMDADNIIELLGYRAFKIETLTSDFKEFIELEGTVLKINYKIEFNLSLGDLVLENVNWLNYLKSKAEIEGLELSYDSSTERFTLTKYTGSIATVTLIDSGMVRYIMDSTNDGILTLERLTGCETLEDLKKVGCSINFAIYGSYGDFDGDNKGRLLRSILDEVDKNDLEFSTLVPIINSLDSYTLVESSIITNLKVVTLWENYSIRDILGYLSIELAKITTYMSYIFIIDSSVYYISNSEDFITPLTPLGVSKSSVKSSKRLLINGIEYINNCLVSSLDKELILLSKDGEKFFSNAVSKKKTSIDTLARNNIITDVETYTTNKEKNFLIALDSVNKRFINRFGIDLLSDEGLSLLNFLSSVKFQLSDECKIVLLFEKGNRKIIKLGIDDQVRKSELTIKEGFTTNCFFKVFNSKIDLIFNI